MPGFRWRSAHTVHRGKSKAVRLAIVGVRTECDGLVGKILEFQIFKPAIELDIEALPDRQVRHAAQAPSAGFGRIIVKMGFAQCRIYLDEAGKSAG